MDKTASTSLVFEYIRFHRIKNRGWGSIQKANDKIKLTKIFTVDLTLCSKCQIYGENFVNFSGLIIHIIFFTTLEDERMCVL